MLRGLIAVETGNWVFSKATLTSRIAGQKSIGGCCWVAQRSAATNMLARASKAPRYGEFSMAFGTGVLVLVGFGGPSGTLISWRVTNREQGCLCGLRGYCCIAARLDGCFVFIFIFLAANY